MSNRIVKLEIRDHSLIPAEAEIHVTVVPEFIDRGTRITGRFMGPRCQFAGTVEVAYHFRPILIPTSQPSLTYRVVIPEASFWEPESPHLYLGKLELWQDEKRCAVVDLCHGLRNLSVSQKGFKINGHIHRLRGRRVDRLDETQALQLRQEGINLLVAKVETAAEGIWEMADRMGFLVLGEITEPVCGELLSRLETHVSCMGWLLCGEMRLPGSSSVRIFGVDSLEHPALAGARFVASSAVGEQSPLPILVMNVPTDRDEAIQTEYPNCIGRVSRL